MKERILSGYYYITGKPPVFTLEARIFHTIGALTLAGLFANIFLNYYIGLPALSWLMLAGFLIVGASYYFSRFGNQFSLGIIIYNVLSNLLLIVNFFYNSGIDGPTLLIFVLSCFINISVAPKKQYRLWLCLNLIVVIALLTYQYTIPDDIKYTYPGKDDRYIDHLYSYVVVTLIMSFITTSIRRNYHFEKKQVEQKAIELEQANVTKNKLFSILAHDIRSPLSSIQNYLEILDEYRLDEEERLSINSELLKTTQNTQQMLSNLLLWTKSQMEGVTVNLAAIRLRDVLDTTLQVQKTVAHEKGIQLINKLKNEQPVIADPDMLQLIVRNLVNNAIKFTNPGGEIEITTETYQGTDCHICIKDNGIGIPFEQQGDVFELKGSSTFGTKNEKGVGLGLLLCKEFTELQNGKIWFESQPGNGTAFYISLKLHKADGKLRENLKSMNAN